MKTIAPLSTVAVPRSPERVIFVERRGSHRTERREVLRENMGETVRVARGAICERRWVIKVPKGVHAIVTLEVLLERGATFRGEVFLEGEGTCSVRRILRVVGPRVTADWVLRGRAVAEARFFEESWMFVAGSEHHLHLRTRFVLADTAHFLGRHFVASQASGASGGVVSSLDVLRQSPHTVATVVPEIGVVPPGLAVQHGARVVGVAEAQREYLLVHGLAPEDTERTLVDAFLYA